jgi:hypothetical protein
VQVGISGITVNTGRAIINGYFFEKDELNKDNPVVITDNGAYYVVIRIYQTAVAGKDARAELLCIKQSDLIQTETGTYDYILCSYNITSGAVQNLTDLRTKTQITDKDIKDLDAGKITSGTLALARIPVLDASRIPNLDAGKITTGTLPITRGGTGATDGTNALNNLGNSDGTKTFYVNKSQNSYFRLNNPASVSNSLTVNLGNNVAIEGVQDVLAIHWNNVERGRIRINDENEGTLWFNNWYNNTSGAEVLIGSGNNLVKVASAKKYKKDIKDIPLTLAQKILEIEPKTFTEKSTGEKGIGFIADDFDEKGLNDVVVYDEKGDVDSLQYSRLTAYLLKVIKDQETRIKELEKKVK